MTVRPELYSFRDTLATETIRDLIGPPHDEIRPDEQVIDEPPLQRFISGMLFPRSTGYLDASLDIDDTDDEDGAHNDPPIRLASVRYPSAMGCSFAVDSRMTSSLDVIVRAARYQPVETADGIGDERWERIPISFEQSAAILIQNPISDARLSVADGLDLYYRVRASDGHGHVAVTAGLINTLDQPADDFRRDANTFFRVELSLTAAGQPAFVDRSPTEQQAADADARSYRLLYRHLGNFAVGHGCSADWTQSGDLPPRATEIRTTFAPSHDVLLADSNEKIKSPYLSMKRLAEDPWPEVIDGLRGIHRGYEQWIDDLDDDRRTLAGAELADTAEDHIKQCRIAADRIGRGIDLLARDEDGLAWTSFRLANEAMLRQRAQTVWLRNRDYAPDLASYEHQWRPFQLAFILLNLEGIVEPAHEDREVVDLLWFPTGGGKTEAYLGLIAFTTFNRRLRSGGTDSGLTVIMRYTLRLLTLQQFQRALLLICACELIRRTRHDLGSDEISIGLWVGGKATPNDFIHAKRALEAHRRGSDVTEGDPVQIRECPWCGTALDHTNYWIRDNQRLVIRCRTEGCDFAGGLPAFLVDEDVYRWRPTLMIATVDKFASLPWRHNVGDLFSVSADRSPPELIIQDELHLIAGPLGTLVGLYETAIDMLCETPGGIGPKVIASTATIRRASSQIGRLYASEGFQFPPPGLDARDSYFAREVARERKGSRRYVGLLAPATSHASLLVRSYAAALQLAASIDADDDVRDPYWTLVGYFNSLRVLGGAVLQVRDDVPDRTEVLATRWNDAPRFETTPEWEELTSRKNGSEIPAILQRMDIGYPDPDAIDVILATNMISVGMDIDRLGLMAVMGQPQSASEYIQSTSRVGRRDPGLIFVLFNANRSRDRSHYESFVAFHQSLYRQVDASSVTPFAARARDRGLHAVLVGLLRACEPAYSANGSASNVTNLESVIRPYRDRILRRVRSVAPDEEDATAAALDDFVAAWKRRVENQPNLLFASPKEPARALLADAAQPGLNPDGTPTLWSLRDVDTETNLYLRRG